MGTMQNHAHTERKDSFIPVSQLNAAEGCCGGYTQSLHWFPEEGDAAGRPAARYCCGQLPKHVSAVKREE